MFQLAFMLSEFIFILVLILPSLFIMKGKWNSNIKYYIIFIQLHMGILEFHHLNYLLYYLKGLNCKGKGVTWNWNCWGNIIKNKNFSQPRNPLHKGIGERKPLCY